MRCYFCRCEEELEASILVFWNVEQLVIICRACINRLVGQKTAINPQALEHSIQANFRPSDRNQILEQACPACGMRFSGFLKSLTPGCFHCRDYFTPLILYLMNHLENDRKLILCPESALEPSAPPARKTAMMAGIREIGHAPHFKIMHLKERFEALVGDEKYEEAKKLSEMIKSLETAAGRR